jgi:hypothetical protein
MRYERAVPVTLSRLRAPSVAKNGSVVVSRLAGAGCCPASFGNGHTQSAAAKIAAALVVMRRARLR